ncbi:MAG: DUF1566 domain-containing protein [Nitrospira sp.]|nr:DUF1566 domain-containing protein [Nitrospira sp.]
MDDLNRYYEILELKPGALLEEIKQAHKDLVSVWHPDRFSHNLRLQQKAQEKLKEINQAYEEIQSYLAGTRDETFQPDHRSVIRLRSRPTTLSNKDVVQMIREKGFSHAYDLSEYELADCIQGNFLHVYRPMALKGDHVVIDQATGLMWQQSGSSYLVTWEKAKDYIDSLNRKHYAGYLDWRLPTIEELTSLLEPTEKNGNLYIDSVFDPTQIWCWSADWVPASQSVWGVYFALGFVSNGLLTNPLYIRAVRSI